MGKDQPDSELVVALLHWPVVHGRVEDNRRELLRLNRRAAELGAQVIVNTEMGLTGYAFDSRSEIAPLVETGDGSSVTALAELAREFELHLALGLAERDPGNGAYHNSAVLLGPDGRIQARRRKVTAEAKWACPGAAIQSDCCDTPFGRLGLLICSETYFSLLPRVMALKGVDLLLTPANWPPTGLDPGQVWRGRALENGFHLAACNRSGLDKRMDCGQARSHLFAPDGRDLLPDRPVEPGVYLARLPLKNGRLPRERRRRILASRRPGEYHYLASQLNRVQDLTTFLELPPTGRLELHCLAGGEQPVLELEALERLLPKVADQARHLAVLPGAGWGRDAQEGLLRLARATGMDFLASLAGLGQESLPHHFAPDASAPSLLGRQDQEPPFLDLGPARVGLASARDLLHPELALALAKRGCDLVAVSAGRLEADHLELLALRSLERVVVALASVGAALVAVPPRGHDPVTLERAAAGQACSFSLDTAQTRSKVYEELLDLPTLLASSSGELGA